MSFYDVADNIDRTPIGDENYSQVVLSAFLSKDNIDTTPIGDGKIINKKEIISMFDDDFMNDMLLNPDLYGMEDEEEDDYDKTDDFDDNGGEDD